MSDRDRRNRNAPKERENSPNANAAGARPEQLGSPHGVASKQPSMIPGRGDSIIDGPGGSMSGLIRSVAGPGATVEQRLMHLESAVKRMDADLKRGNEFIKQQVKSLERMGQQRFDSLDARNKGLEQRIERVSNGGVDDETRGKIEALLADSPKGKEIQRGNSSNRLDSTAMERMEMIARQAANNEQELARMTEHNFEGERRLQDYVNQRLEQFEQSVQSSSHAQVSPIAQTQVRGGLPAPYGEFAMVGQTPLMGGVPAPHTGYAMVEQSQVRGGVPAPHTEYAMVGQPLVRGGLPASHNTGASEAMAEKQQASDSAAALEQVHHLSDSLTLWASRQKGYERRLAVVEGKLGLNGEALMQAPPDRKARILTCC